MPLFFFKNDALALWYERWHFPKSTEKSGGGAFVSEKFVAYVTRYQKSCRYRPRFPETRDITGHVLGTQKRFLPLSTTLTQTQLHPRIVQDKCTILEFRALLGMTNPTPPSEWPASTVGRGLQPNCRQWVVATSHLPFEFISYQLNNWTTQERSYTPHTSSQLNKILFTTQPEHKYGAKWGTKCGHWCCAR